MIDDLFMMNKIELMTVEKKKKDQVVLVGHWMCRGGVVMQRWLWRLSHFSSLMVLPFETVSVDSVWWGLQRIEKDEIYSLFEVIWTRNEKDMKISLVIQKS